MYINLKYIDLSNLNTLNGTNKEYMLNGGHQLREINGIDNLNTNKVESI